jgi:ketosteroid isomerase-like protein
VQGLLGAIAGVADCTVAVTATLPTDAGFVQTQQNIYTFRDGAATAFHAALVATLDDEGRITRLEEYLDSAGLAPLIAALGAAVPSDAATLVERIFAATDAKDTAAKLELVTDDVVLMFGNAEPVRGRDGFARTSDEFNASLDSVRHEITALYDVPDADVVVVELRVHYRRLDGQELTLPCANCFHLRDGRIAEYRIYMDINPVYA